MNNVYDKLIAAGISLVVVILALLVFVPGESSTESKAIIAEEGVIYPPGTKLIYPTITTHINTDGATVYPRGYLRQNGTVMVDWVRLKKVVSYGNLLFLPKNPHTCLSIRPGINHRKITFIPGSSEVAMRFQGQATEMYFYIGLVEDGSNGCGRP